MLFRYNISRNVPTKRKETYHTIWPEKCCFAMVGKTAFDLFSDVLNVDKKVYKNHAVLFYKNRRYRFGRAWFQTLWPDTVTSTLQAKRKTAVRMFRGTGLNSAFFSKCCNKGAIVVENLENSLHIFRNSRLCALNDWLRGFF